ncbi:MAG: hypothetical protein KIT16_00455 [Rhodospirillaceae bacterium]|nr:hypothetical protein [Rhodospirillaceae bacterium]
MPRFPASAATLLAILAFCSAPARAEGEMEAAYRQACGECHANPRVVAGRFASLADGARQQRWETFLLRHHGGEPEQRALLIRYFESLRGK